MKLRPSDTAWIALGAGVIAYDAACPKGELLSEGVDRYLLRRPWVTRLVIAVTAAHLLNLLPATVDPFYRLAILLGR